MTHPFPHDFAGRFELLRLLGRGGMASVWLARVPEDGTLVALKVLEEHGGGDGMERVRFGREQRVASALDHPNVVRVLDTGEHDGVPFIAMEYVDGATLREYAHGRTVPVENVVDLALQACAGLAHAHEQGIVHRDIKPQNILVGKDGVLKVADFGVARAPDEAQITSTGLIVGTISYLAPEQGAEGEITARTDLFSLGVVLYELLTGERPFPSESLADLVAQQQAPAIPPIRDRRPDVSPQLEDAIIGCLARDPQYRPASAQELRRLIAGDEAPTRPVATLAPEHPTIVLGLPGDAGPPSRGAPRLAAVGAATLVCVAAGIALLGGGDDDPGDATSARSTSREPQPASDGAAERPATTTDAPAPAEPPETTPDEPVETVEPREAGLSRSEAIALHGQADRLRQQGRYAEALPQARQALANLGGIAPWEAYASYNLGATLAHLGSCEEGLPLLDRSERLQGYRREIDEARALCGREDADEGSKDERDKDAGKEGKRGG